MKKLIVGLVLAASVALGAAKAQAAVFTVTAQTVQGTAVASQTNGIILKACWAAANPKGATSAGLQFVLQDGNTDKIRISLPPSDSTKAVIDFSVFKELFTISGNLNWQASVNDASSELTCSYEFKKPN